MDEIKTVETKVKQDVIDYEAIVEAWFKEHFHGVVGLETSLYNRFYQAKEALKTKLKG